MVEWWARRLTVWYETLSHVRYTYRESSTRIATPQVQAAPRAPPSPEHAVNKACTYKANAIFSMLKYIWYTTETRQINSPLRFSFCGDREQTLLPCIYRVVCYQTSKIVDLFEVYISCPILSCQHRRYKPVFNKQTLAINEHKMQMSVDFNKIYLGNDSCFVDMFSIDIFCLPTLISGIVTLSHALKGSPPLPLFPSLI